MYILIVSYNLIKRWQLTAQLDLCHFFYSMCKTLSTGTLEDVQEMAGKTTDRNNLINCISIMKQYVLFIYILIFYYYYVKGLNPYTLLHKKLYILMLLSISQWDACEIKAEIESMILFITSHTRVSTVMRRSHPFMSYNSLILG